MWAQAVAAITRWPSGRDWRSVTLEVILVAPVLALLGIAGGFVGVAPPPDAAAFLRLAAIAIIVPAFGEELIFRVMALGSTASLPRCVAAILLFVVWHPLQVFLFGERWREVVLNPLFLCAVVLLGIVLTRTYLKTRSIWPPVIIHWLTVLAWKLAGGPSPWG